jgi:hypothetical protein
VTHEALDVAQREIALGEELVDLAAQMIAHEVRHLG